jgi:alkanesulfonate monooxygenase SsuD/methylene tetrahydromethanopterin reductase-like flavin-dependent oxidoreductase (luciferase family)
MTLATTISLASLRGPVPLAKTLAALELLSGGRLVAGVGPGSSKRGYDALGISFEDRWKRFDEAVMILRALLRDEPVPDRPSHFALPDAPLAPAPPGAAGIPLWIGSWGSPAGLRRVARLGDGWLASGYNTTPEQFASARETLAVELARQGKSAERFPNALVTMWTWITGDRADRDRVLGGLLSPLLRRDPAQLGAQGASDPRITARNCFLAMPRPDASASTSGRWVTRHGSLSSPPRSLRVFGDPARLINAQRIERRTLGRRAIGAE